MRVPEVKNNTRNTALKRFETMYFFMSPKNWTLVFFLQKTYNIPYLGLHNAQDFAHIL
jgi:hypothetical protein